MNDCPELIEIKKRSNTTSLKEIALAFTVSMFKKNCNDIQWLNIFLLILTIMWEDIYLFKNRSPTSCSKRCGRTFISYTSLIGRCSTSSGDNKMIVCVY
ncbi:hypothetical protein PVAP13_9NG065845 [Panicum virgatum]|uniref:Uncharacterized protein n=1 Tax=Panicum virgatum TaxID=38727 RepID=A0A8T0MDZ5_PANVG|nr:hypothetical protein PVAP13_9NG065845 [Panicum virgatum]